MFPEPIPEQSERPDSAVRITDTQRSTVFAGPVQEKPRRKKLGANDAGVENLFGDQRVDFDNKSNTMPILSTKKGKVWKPVRQQKTAEQRRQEEFYGKSAVVHGVGKKKDGTLMANNADWRNPNQTHTNASNSGLGNQAGEINSREKKFENLSSNIFGSED